MTSFHRTALTVLTPSLIMGSTLFSPTSAGALLTLSPVTAVYEEDFEGETAFPASPEINDELYLPIYVDNTSGTSGSIAAGNANLDVSFSTNPAEDLALDIVNWGAGSIGIRAYYSAFDPSPVSSEDPKLRSALRYQGGPGLVLLTAGLEFDASPGGEVTAAFCLREATIEVPGLTFAITEESCDPLTPTQTNTILQGDTFQTDFFLDKEASPPTISASLRIDRLAALGQPDDEIGPLATSALSQGDLPDLAGLSLLIAGTAPGHVASADLDAISFHRVFDETIDATNLIDDGDPFFQCLASALNCSVRSALDRVYLENHDRADVVLSPGVHTLSLLGVGDIPAPLTPTTGDLDVWQHVRLRGDGADSTVIDATLVDRVLEVHPNARLELVDLALRGGDTGGDGGGLLTHGMTWLRDCRVVDNTASNNGGGIHSEHRLHIDHCVIGDNVAAEGGGVWSGGGSDARFEARRSAVVRNGVTSAHGGLYLGTGPASLIENTTVSGNTDSAVHFQGRDATVRHATLVGSGAALSLQGATFSSAQISVENVAMRGSPACDESDPFGTATLVDGGGNLIEDSSCGFGAIGGPLGLGSLLAIAETEGRVPTVGSPLVDAAAGATCTLLDQTGGLRPIDGDGIGGPQCDVGAIEVPEPSGALPLAVLALARTGRFRRRSMDKKFKRAFRHRR